MTEKFDFEQPQGICRRSLATIGLAKKSSNDVYTRHPILDGCAFQGL